MRAFCSVTVIVVATIVLNTDAQDSTADIRQFVNNPGLDGNFVYGFESSNGIRVEARGSPAKTGGQAIAGRYSWRAGDDGRTYTIQYTADHNGYQPLGAHLPTPPPIPLAILRSIDYNDRHPEEDVSHTFTRKST